MITKRTKYQVSKDLLDRIGYIDSETYAELNILQKELVVSINEDMSTGEDKDINMINETISSALYNYIQSKHTLRDVIKYSLIF